MRDLLQCYPIITVDQFLTNKFLDLKLQFVTELAKNVYEWDMNQRNRKVARKGKEMQQQQKIIQKEEEE